MGPISTVVSNNMYGGIVKRYNANVGIYHDVKYLDFYSSRSLKTREKFIRFTQFVFEGSVFTS